MPKAVFISIRRPSPAEGANSATVQGYALRAPAGRPIILTVAPPRPALTVRPFSDAFRALGLSREGR